MPFDIDEVMGMRERDPPSTSTARHLSATVMYWLRVSADPNCIPGCFVVVVVDMLAVPGSIPCLRYLF